MKTRDTVKICKKCGKPIDLIRERLYRTIIVDAEAVEVIADPLGDNYVKWDGHKIRARAVKPDEIAEGAEFAYRPHRWSCGGEYYE